MRRDPPGNPDQSFPDPVGDRQRVSSRTAPEPAAMSDEAERAARLAEEKMKPTVEVADARPPEFSDEALAQRFAERHGDELRYVAAWSHWYAWNGVRWGLDSTLDAFDRARAICRAASSEPNKSDVKKALASAKTVAAVERLAKADRRIAATVEQWDADPDTFNTEAMPPGHDGGATGDEA